MTIQAAAAEQGSVRRKYDVFISHAGAQKDFALWIRNHVRICGYEAFVDERSLRYGCCRCRALPILDDPLLSSPCF